MTYRAYRNYQTMDDKISRFLKCATRQSSEADHPLLLTDDNIEALASEHARTPVPQNIKTLIDYLH
jgi:hypothetical protein